MKFIVPGQGVFLFKKSKEIIPMFSFTKNQINQDEKQIKLYLYDSTKKNNLCITLTTKSISLTKNNTEQKKDPNNKSGLVNQKGAYYWVSLDSQNQQIYIGVGEPRLETSIFQYKFSHDEKTFLESLIKIKAYNSTNNIFKTSNSQATDTHSHIFKQIKDPITQKIPLKIKNTDELTMADISTQRYMPKSNLSLTSQKLYDCISGKKFQLDESDFTNFSNAIEHSIKTPGLWCHETLKKKSTEFDPKNPNPKETYLRITLGQNNGESPGIPYVMEIWPPGHFSPIHSHANASAVIRVLHGEINVKLFPFLCHVKKQSIEPSIEPLIDPFAIANFKKDDITWISPTLNQTHQLSNINPNTTCVTIQCYMYEDTNNKHYDFFDYLDSNNEKKQYEPDSDMEYIDFKELMKQEWSNRLAQLMEPREPVDKYILHDTSVNITLMNTSTKIPFK